ncbi:MAG: 1-acyl-sn-glycerol-3-phosphate acyltransferase [Cyanobium sp.]
MPAAAPLEFLPPQLDPRVLSLSRRLLPLWLQRQSGITGSDLRQPQRLVQAMDRFQAGESRLLLAFRHPSLDDPACLAQLLWHDLPREARRRGRRWRSRPHAQFLYDRGIPLWAGAPTGWLLSRLGGCSIQRGKLDTAALRTARQLLLEGPYPLAVAPEGATNGHNERVSSLEPGVAQLAYWTADDLDKAGRSEAMAVLPIGLQYTFSSPVWQPLEALLSQLEQDCGLALDPGHDLDPDRLYGRLFALAERMLTLMETFYSKAYRRPLPAAADEPAAAQAEGEALGQVRGQARGQRDNQVLAWRLRHLLETALQELEQSLAIEAHGDLASRCRRLEQAGWERLYPSGNGSGQRSRLERGLADRLAEETEQRMWHMRLVESFVAVSGSYVRQRPSQERFADTLLLLWDTHCRILGGNPGERPRLGPRRVLISIGEPIEVRRRLATYRTDRRRAVADLTAELQASLEAMVVPSGDPGR